MTDANFDKLFDLLMGTNFLSKTTPAFSDKPTADVAVTKTIDLRNSEFKRLVFRLEAFNLFNHPQFAIPVRTLESPAFGKSIQTTIPARTFQIVVK